MKKLVFIFLLALGFAWNCHAQTWTFVQETLNAYCVPGHSTCSFSAGSNIPTTAGTVRVIFIRTSSGASAPNVTITSVTGGGSTWNLCPASSCHILGNDDLDMAYAIGGSSGLTNFVVTLSGASGTSFFSVWLYEFLPPAGTTASFDASGTANHNCTSGSTTGVTLSTSATDLILTGRGNGDPSGPLAYSSPYTQLPSNNAVAINATNGNAPTVGCSGSTLIFNAIAFKSTAGSFTPPTTHMKAVNYTNNNNVLVNCTPSCTLTIPSTGSGNLLYLEVANINSKYISSVSGAGGGWVVPTAANTCRISMSPGYSLSCAYLLSTTAGATSLSLTMTGSTSIGFAAMEVQPLSGTFSFDAQGSTFNSTASYNPPGQALSLTGSDDVIFQAAFISGGSTGNSYYPMPPSAPKTLAMFLNNDATFAAALDVPYGAFPANAQPAWINQQNSATIVTGVAFKAISGTATHPNPPTSLTAVVN